MQRIILVEVVECRSELLEPWQHDCPLWKELAGRILLLLLHGAAFTGVSRGQPL